jgi:hypothetical protein
MAPEEHTCGTDGRRLFCSECGKLVDRDGLKRVRVVGFHGRSSTNPKVEEFFATGDPAVFDRR